MIGELEIDSSTERVGDGVHALSLSGRWGLDDGRLNGGYQLAVALRALAAEVSMPDPVVASATFLRPAAPVSRRVRFAAPELPGWARGAPAGDPRAEFWFAFADGSDATLLDLAFVVDGAAPVVLDLGRGSSTVQLTVHLRERPAPGPLRCRTVTHHLAHGLHEEDVEVWDAAGALVAQSRQLALLL